MRTKYVVVEDYNPKWKSEFERIKNELLTVLSGKINSIEHVGGTSVEGLASKPIIDIDVVIDKNFEEVKKALEYIGYIDGSIWIKGKYFICRLNRKNYECQRQNAE
jgi:GrpB-like predicted nucleotidyltransferase (UPF0157 family)